MKTSGTSSELKEIVKEKYGEIANQISSEDTGCCGSTCGCGALDATMMSEDYTQTEGYVAEADLGLGCGLPTAFARMKNGDTVVDLGSGAGNDVFVARSIVGPSGKVIGIDMTDPMIDRARRNAEKLGFNNVEFRFGDIENIPLSEDIADVVISNCVLNLVPDKQKAFEETFRILKPGGHFSISDIVLEGHLPAGLKQAAELYVGCVAGAIRKGEFLKIVSEAGFTNVRLEKEKRIAIPEDLLKQYISDAELQAFINSGTAILSITVYAEKPVPKQK
jgi:arsenite methyltransferase